MRYCEKIQENIYGVHLEIGEIDIRRSNHIACYFIVNHIDDKDFIAKQARQLLITGCRQFDIYGKCKDAWHNGIDLQDVLLNLRVEEYEVAMTNGYDDIEIFAEDLYENALEKGIVCTDYYVLYDDYEAFEELKKYI